MLILDKITKKFGGIKALSEVSIQFYPGWIYSIVGPNGCGKTSLLNIISGFYTADSGNLYWGSCSKKSIIRLTPEKRAKLGIGRVFQEPRSFGCFTVEENLLLSLMPEGSDNLFTGGLKARPTKLAQGKIEQLLASGNLETNRFSNAANLSYGQKKILDILSLLAREPKLLLLDEPYEGVDPKNLQVLNALINRHGRSPERSIIFVSHELGLVKEVADFVILMDEGKVVISGPPLDIMDSPEFKEVFLG